GSVLDHQLVQRARTTPPQTLGELPFLLTGQSFVTFGHRHAADGVQRAGPPSIRCVDARVGRYARRAPMANVIARGNVPQRRSAAPFRCLREGRTSPALLLESAHDGRTWRPDRRNLPPARRRRFPEP